MLDDRHHLGAIRIARSHRCYASWLFNTRLISLGPGSRQSRTRGIRHECPRGLRGADGHPRSRNVQRNVGGGLGPCEGCVPGSFRDDCPIRTAGNRTGSGGLGHAGCIRGHRRPALAGCVIAPAVRRGALRSCAPDWSWQAMDASGMRVRLVLAGVGRLRHARRIGPGGRLALAPCGRPWSRAGRGVRPCARP